MQKKTKSPELLNAIMNHEGLKSLYIDLNQDKKQKNIMELKIKLKLVKVFIEDITQDEETRKKLYEEISEIINENINKFNIQEPVNAKQLKILEERFGNQSKKILDYEIQKAFIRAEEETRLNSLRGNNKQKTPKGVTQEYQDLTEQKKLTGDSLILIEEIKDEKMKQEIQKYITTNTAKIYEIAKILEQKNPNITVNEILAKLPKEYIPGVTKIKKNKNQKKWNKI